MQMILSNQGTQNDVDSMILVDRTASQPCPLQVLPVMQGWGAMLLPQSGSQLEVEGLVCEAEVPTEEAMWPNHAEPQNGASCPTLVTFHCLQNISLPGPQH